MLVNEDQACMKWCPFARVIVGGESDSEPVASANRMPGLGGQPDPDLEWPSPRCVGSECMSWRWAGWKTSFDTVAPNPRDHDKRGERLGFCGLAGQPYPLSEPVTP